MDYVSIRVSTLRGDQKIDFNAYIKINEKMVLYLRRGDSFEGERLLRLKEKKLTDFWSGTIDAGFSLTAGNSDTRSFSAGLRGVRETPKRATS